MINIRTLIRRNKAMEEQMEASRVQLESVLCDADGKVCISGSEEDRRIVQEALSKLRSPRA